MAFDTGWLPATSTDNAAVSKGPPVFAGSIADWVNPELACQSYIDADSSWATCPFNGSILFNPQVFQRYAFADLATEVPADSAIRAIWIRALGWNEYWNNSAPGSVGTPQMAVGFTSSTDTNDFNGMAYVQVRDFNFNDEVRLRRELEFLPADPEVSAWPTAADLISSTFRVSCRAFRAGYIEPGAIHLDCIEVRVIGSGSVDLDPDPMAVSFAGSSGPGAITQPVGVRELGAVAMRIPISQASSFTLEDHDLGEISMQIRISNPNEPSGTLQKWRLNHPAPIQTANPNSGGGRIFASATPYPKLVNGDMMCYVLGGTDERPNPFNESTDPNYYDGSQDLTGAGPWAIERVDGYNCDTDTWAEVATPAWPQDPYFPGHDQSRRPGHRPTCCWIKPHPVSGHNRIAIFGGIPHMGPGLPFPAGAYDDPPEYAPRNHMFIWTPATNELVEVDPPLKPQGRWDMGWAELPDGRMIIFGGMLRAYNKGVLANESGGPGADLFPGASSGSDTWVYDPEPGGAANVSAGGDGDWTEYAWGPEPVPRGSQFMASMPDGKILMAAGQQRTGNAFWYDCWIFDPVIGKWEPDGGPFLGFPNEDTEDPEDRLYPFGVPVAAGGLCRFDDDHMLMICGLSYTSAHMQEARIYHIPSHTWALTDRPLWAGRDYEIAFQVREGLSMVGFGWGNTQQYDDELAAWTYERVAGRDPMETDTQFHFDMSVQVDIDGIGPVRLGPALSDRYVGGVVGNFIPAPPVLFGVDVEAFSVSHVAILDGHSPADEGLIGLDLYGVREAGIAPDVEEHENESDDGDLAYWAFIASAELTVAGGFIPFDLLADMWAIPVDTSGAGDAVQHQIELWHEDTFNLAPRPVLIRAPARDANGRPMQLDVVLYRVQFAPVTFDGPRYKDGLTINWSGRVTLSDIDEIGLPLGIRSFGRIVARTPM